MFRDLFNIVKNSFENKETAKVAEKHQQTFAETRVISQEFNLKSIFDNPTPSSDITGFDSNPRGAFADQKLKFQRQKIKQLNMNRNALVVRGDPREVSFLLKAGILPKSLSKPVDIENHRHDNDSSGGLSFSTKLSVAVRSGANSSRYSKYGPYKIKGDGTFAVVAAELPGSKYDVAGPSSRMFIQESEATVAGAVEPENIVGYRKCQLKPDQQRVSCSSIFTRMDLSSVKRAHVEDFLCGKYVK